MEENPFSLSECQQLANIVYWWQFIKNNFVTCATYRIAQMKEEDVDEHIEDKRFQQCTGWEAIISNASELRELGQEDNMPYDANFFSICYSIFHNFLALCVQKIGDGTLPVKFLYMWMQQLVPPDTLCNENCITPSARTIRNAIYVCTHTSHNKRQKTLLVRLKISKLVKWNALLETARGIFRVGETKLNQQIQPMSEFLFYEFMFHMNVFYNYFSYFNQPLGIPYYKVEPFLTKEQSLEMESFPVKFCFVSPTCFLDTHRKLYRQMGILSRTIDLYVTKDPFILMSWMSVLTIIWKSNCALRERNSYPLPSDGNCINYLPSGFFKRNTNRISIDVARFVVKKNKFRAYYHEICAIWLFYYSVGIRYDLFYNAMMTFLKHCAERNNQTLAEAIDSMEKKVFCVYFCVYNEILQYNQDILTEDVDMSLKMKERFKKEISFLCDKLKLFLKK